MKFALHQPNGQYINADVFQMELMCKDPKLNALKTFEYEPVSDDFFDHHSDFIPVGSLEFVNSWLRRFHNIPQMNPIEVPDVLRTPEFLLREYSIEPLEKLPRNERRFFKYAEGLKIGFCGTGTLEEIKRHSELKSGLYVNSELLWILSEYRVVVHNDNILAVRHYDGDPFAQFNPLAVRKMVYRYMLDPNRPKAYTMDIAVTDQGTAILEVHPFVSVGTYGYYSSNLPYLYRDGLEYYIATNAPVRATATTPPEE